MTTWRVTLGCAVLALAAAACSGDDGDAAGTTTTTEPSSTTTAPTTTTVPERPSSTTTTAFAPTTVEGEVEAAYLRSWDVYAEAVYNLELDEAALAASFAGEALELRRAEIDRRVAERRASLVHLDHQYQIARVDDSTFSVVDNFTNHQVLIDPTTKEPIEPDPDELLLVNFKMSLIDGQWRVVFIQKVSP